jgi:23S rRNA (cytidine1920-2'-O)/16S rRNA (cytidine1409-2'-O)-methyltransferase
VGDVSFISLRLVLPALAELDPRQSLLLVKPQFEAGRQEAARGHGVITDPAIWRRVLTTVVDRAVALDFACGGVMVSPITGRAGNVEFVILLTRNRTTDSGVELGRCINTAVAEAEAGAASS